MSRQAFQGSSPSLTRTELSRRAAESAIARHSIKGLACAVSCPTDLTSMDEAEAETETVSSAIAASSQAGGMRLDGSETSG